MKITSHPYVFSDYPRCKIFLAVLSMVVLFILLFTNISAAQAPIQFGQMIASSISSPGESDEYAFVADAGDVILIMMSTDADLDPAIELYDPEGNYINDNYEESPGIVELYTDALSTAGVYKIIVSDFGHTETGKYRIYIQRLNNPGMATPINFGEMLSSSILSPHETDTYTFDAVAGDNVQIRMGTDTGFDPRFRLFGPDGVFITEDFVSGPGTAYSEIQMPATGSYTLLAEDWADIENGDYGAETGDYRIYAQRLNNPEMAAHINFGENLAASIASANEVDTYTFDAAAGDVVQVRMPTISGLDPEWWLFGPDGAYVAQDFASGPGMAYSEIETPATGTYTLMVEDWADIENGDYGTETGNYWIYVQRVNNPGGAAKIVFGETLPASIASIYDVGTYTFDALEGDRIWVRMSTDTGLDPQCRLFGPDGAYITENFDPGPGTAYLDIEAPATGAYTLMAEDWADPENGDYGTETGNYWIYAQRINNPGRASQIVFGETLPAALSAAYEVDTYRFDALLNDVVRVTASTDTGLDLIVLLYGPDGAYIAETEFTGPGMETIETQSLAATGTYSLLAWNPGSGKETGEYSITLNLIAGNPGSLTVTPAEGLHATGHVGGPFSPSSMIYTLENKGNQPIEWNLAKTQTWLDVSSESGTLEAGKSVTVTASLNTERVGEFPIGLYTDTLIFTNVSEANRKFLRSVSLKVDPIEGILEVSPNDPFSPAGVPGGPFDPPGIIYTVRNIGEKSLNWSAAKTAYWLSLAPDHGVLSPGDTVDVVVSLTEVAAALSIGVRKDMIAFNNQSNGYGNTTRAVTFSIGVISSEITVEISKSPIILGESLEVSGKILPAPCDAGAWVDVVFASTGGDEIHQSVIANALGEFNYSLACGDLNRAGTWTVNANWNGDRCLGGAVGAGQLFEVTKADTRITVDAGSRAVKLGDGVDISGKLTPEPDCGAGLTGREIKLLIIGPGGRSDLQTLYTIDRFGHFVLQNYQGFTALGTWNIQALFLGNDAYAESHSNVITIQVNETAGYAIILQGKIFGEEGLGSHSKTASFVYRQLRQRGLLDEDIFYLNYDALQEGVDATPTKDAVQNAIVKWAKDKMNLKPANLYMVLVDHGLEDRFFIYPDEIGSQEMGIWLDALQNELFGQAAVQEIVVLLGFCRSGSFIDNLSGWNRVIIASAAADESSYKGPLDPEDAGGVRDGEFFITEFFKSAALGKDILSCFKDAVAKTELFTSTGTGQPNGPYTDDARQHPLLEDNGDSVGVNDPSGDPGYDGYLSQGVFIGVSSVTGNAPGDIQVTHVSGTQFLDAGQDVAPFWARVDNNTRMRSLWLEVKAPGFEPGPGGTEQIEMDLPRYAYGSYNPAQDRYEWNSVSGFTEPGTYQVFFFARDDLSGNESSIQQTVVYKNNAGNKPPGAFDLLLPQDGAESRTMLLLDWSGSTDPDGDTLTYTVEISEDSTFLKVIHRSERLLKSYCLIGRDAGLRDLKTYYWRVIAVDYFGASTAGNQIRSFKTDNTNLMTGWIIGYVYDSSTGQSITNGSVTIGSLSVNTALDGYYIGVLPPGTYSVTATAAGYAPGDYSGVVIHDGSLATRDFGLVPVAGIFKMGDLDHDGFVNLADSILAMQLLTGSPLSAGIYFEADVNGDSKIGLEEVIYILQKVSELRDF